MRRTAPVLALWVALVAACANELIDHGGGQGDGGVSLQNLAPSGRVTQVGPLPAPASAKVMVMWTVREGPTEQHHKFGEGTANATTYQLTLSTPPPTAALNNANAGVGVLYLVPSTTVIPDGPVDDSNIKDVALGAAGDYAIIYRIGSPTFPTWIGAFPNGYSCGIGVSSGTGGEKRSFAPTNCSDLRIDVDELGSIAFVHWD